MRKFIMIIVVIVIVGFAIFSSKADKYLVPAEVRNESTIPISFIEDVARMQQARTLTDLKILFSHEEFFYNEAIQVSLSLLVSDDDVSIYYTMDGSTPTNLSTKYNEPIFLEVRDTPDECTVIKAIAISGEGISPIAVHSYFIHPSAETRFSTLVFSLSTDEFNLTDYEYGILVKGKLYDEFMRENDYPEMQEFGKDANYMRTGREWERPVHVELFTSQGERIITQNAGLRVSGNSTRVYAQKSLRLIARNEYEDGKGKFSFEFFPNLTNVYGAPIISYDTIVLSNGGNDHDIAMIRTPLNVSIAKEAGFSTINTCRPAAVFLNGEYYGFVWIYPRQNEQFFEDYYYAADRFFEINNDLYSYVVSETDENGEEFYLDYYSPGTMLIEERYERFSERFDVDNLLFYHALELYAGNTDWPHGNSTMWRYTGEQGDGEMDGRYRFLVHDMDGTFLLLEPPASLNDRLDEQLPVLKNLLERDELAQQFMNYMCDMAFVHYSVENVEHIIQNMDEESLKELEISSKYHAVTEQRDPNLFSNILQRREVIIDFVRERPDIILDELREVFGVTSLFHITATDYIKINSVTTGEGWYFVENEVLVTANLPKYHVFDYWIVNGESRYEETLMLNADDAMDGKVFVELEYHEEEPTLKLISAFDKDDLSGFSIQNTTDGRIDVKDLYLSDNRYDLKKWAIPYTSVSPGGTMDFVGKDHQNVDALLKIALNFNPRFGEVVFLSDKDGNIIDSVIIAEVTTAL